MGTKKGQVRKTARRAYEKKSNWWEEKPKKTGFSVSSTRLKSIFGRLK